MSRAAACCFEGVKETVIWPLLNKLLLAPSDLRNYWPILDVPLLGKLIEHVVSSQLGGGGRMDYLNPFQSGFKPSFGMESTLVTLVDDFRKYLDRESGGDKGSPFRSLHSFWFHKPYYPSGAPSRFRYEQVSLSHSTSFFLLDPRKQCWGTDALSFGLSSRDTTRFRLAPYAT